MSNLRKSLNEAHITGKDKLLPFLKDSTRDYLLKRVQEELSRPVQTREGLILSIRLLNLYKVKMEEADGAVQSKEA